MLKISKSQLQRLPERGFQNLTNLRNFSSENKNVIIFSEKRIVGYSQQKMFSVVSDVENYHKFVPYCRKSTVTLKEDCRLSANLVVGFKPFLNLIYSKSISDQFCCFLCFLRIAFCI